MIGLQQSHGDARREGISRKNVGASVCVRPSLKNKSRHMSGGQVKIPLGFRPSFRGMEGIAQANHSRGVDPTCGVRGQAGSGRTAEQDRRPSCRLMRHVVLESPGSQSEAIESPIPAREDVVLICPTREVVGKSALQGFCDMSVPRV